MKMNKDLVRLLNLDYTTLTKEKVHFKNLYVMIEVN